MPVVAELSATFTDRASSGMTALATSLGQVGTQARAAGASAAAGGGGLDKMTESARTMAQQGLGPLLQAVPGVGGAFARLLQGLGGLPLAIGAIIGAGVALIGTLKQMSAEATATANAVTTASGEIAARTKAAAAELAGIEATLAGNKVAAAQAAFDKVIALAEQERDARIRAAETAREKELSGIFVTNAAKLQAEATFEAAVGQARADAALETLVARRKLAADEATITKERTAAEQAELDKTVAAEIQAAEQRKAALQGFVSEAIGLTQMLGAGFEDLTRKLQIAQAMDANARALQTFTQLAQAGVITAQEFAQVQARLATQLADLAQGILPAATAGTQSLDAATQSLTATTDAAAESFVKFDENLAAIDKNLVAISGGFDEIQQSIQTATQAAQAFGQALTNLPSTPLGGQPAFHPGVGGPVVPTVGGGGGGVPIPFQGGGVVPGPVGIPRLIMAHGGEEVLTPEQRAPAVPPITITLQGTHIIESGRAIQHLSRRMNDLIADSIRRRR